MLRAAPPGHPLQKPTVVQWDIGAMLSAGGAADESVSPQSGINPLAQQLAQRQQAREGFGGGRPKLAGERHKLHR